MAVSASPRGRPAAPSTSDPVQTEVMYLAPAACWRRKASISSSLIMSSVPSIGVDCGQSAKVVVGVSVSRGFIRLAPGRLENTCNGPVKSSWVTRGERRETDLKRRGRLTALTS